MTGIPCVEVHMKNLEARGGRSVLAKSAIGVIMGFKEKGYLYALDVRLAGGTLRVTESAAGKGDGRDQDRRREDPLVRTGSRPGERPRRFNAPGLVLAPVSRGVPDRRILL